jgi:diacylglycerol kinase family enzyme
MRARVAVIVNTAAGSVSGEDQADLIGKAFDESGIEAAIHPVNPGRQLKSAIASAQEKAAIIVAAGGDGTVSAVASQLVGTDKILGVLPFGTLNNFSKDLGIPQDLREAVGVIAANHIRKVDIGEVNGRYFINNSSIGLYPQIVRKRKQQQRLGRGKWWAAAWAAWRLLRIFPFIRVRLRLEGNELWRKTPFVFVGNNSYEMDFYNIRRRPKLDDGRLSIYLLHRSGRMGLFLLVLKTLFGRLKQAKDFEEFHTAKMRIETRRRALLVAYDGEVAMMKSPLEYRIHRRKLNVLAPDEEK